MSPVLGRPPRAPRSRPVKPGATAPGLGEGITAGGEPTGAPRATRPDEARCTNEGLRGTPERHATGHSPGTRTGAKNQQPAGAANPESADNTRAKVPRKTGPPCPDTAPRTRGQQAPAARPKDGRSGVGKRPNPNAPQAGRMHPSRAPLCCSHRAQRRLTSARAVGQVVDHHAHIPRTHSQWVAGPGRRPQGRAVPCGRASNPGRPTAR